MDTDCRCGNLDQHELPGRQMRYGASSAVQHDESAHKAECDTPSPSERQLQLPGCDEMMQMMHGEEGDGWFERRLLHNRQAMTKAQGHGILPTAENRRFSWNESIRSFGVL